MSADRPTLASAQLRRTLYAAALLRALAIGMIAVLIGLYCDRLGFSALQIGVVLSAALWGAAAATLAATLAGHRVRARTLLVALSLAPAAAAALMLATDAFVLVAAAAFFGMFAVQGRDRGAIPILEQALLPDTAGDAERTRVFATYNVVLDLGYAAGALAAGLPTLLETAAGLAPLAALQIALLLFCLLYLAAAVLYARLPAAAGRAQAGDHRTASCSAASSCTAAANTSARCA